MIPDQFKSLLAMNKKKKKRHKNQREISINFQTINKDPVSRQIRFQEIEDYIYYVAFHR